MAFELNNNSDVIPQSSCVTSVKSTRICYSDNKLHWQIVGDPIDPYCHTKMPNYMFILLLLTRLTLSLKDSLVWISTSQTYPEISSIIKGVAKDPVRLRWNITTLLRGTTLSTIKISDWTSLVRRPQCVTKIELFINNDWKEKTKQNAKKKKKTGICEWNELGNSRLKLKFLFLCSLDCSSAEYQCFFDRVASFKNSL